MRSYLCCRLRWLDTVFKNGEFAIQIRVFGRVVLVEKQKASYFCKTTSKEFENFHNEKVTQLSLSQFLKMENLRFRSVFLDE